MPAIALAVIVELVVVLSNSVAVVVDDVGNGKLE
jgi:hypothetical protein